jgi:hypothetical protein
MANIYVKLKDEYAKREDAKAKEVYGQLIYPGEDRWVTFRDSILDLIKRHKDFELFDIKSQEDMDNIKQKRKEEITDIVNGNWKRSEKSINQINDKEKLNDIRKLAMNNDRKIIVKLVDARLEELKFLEG